MPLPPSKVSNALKALLELREEQILLREQVVGRLDSLETTLSREMRAVGGVLVDGRELLRDRLNLRDQVGDHERRLAALERRAG